MAARSCEACGKSFEPYRSTQRFCSTKCRVRGHRGASVFRMPAAGDVDPDGIPSLVDATRLVLIAAERLSSPAGVRALRLAQKLDEGGDTGSAMASLSKAQGEALAEALKDAPRADDGVDELKARRAKRVGLGA